MVYTFFHTLYRDSEPEVARKQASKLNKRFQFIILAHVDIRSDYLTPPQIHLRLSYEEVKGEFRVFIGHAKQLPFIGRDQTPDTYVKTYLRQSTFPTQKYLKKKTLIVKNAQNPTYNTEV